jgi:hypothetical protein
MARLLDHFHPLVCFLAVANIILKMKEDVVHADRWPEARLQEGQKERNP